VPRLIEESASGNSPAHEVWHVIESDGLRCRYHPAQLHELPLGKAEHRSKLAQRWNLGLSVAREDCIATLLELPGSARERVQMAKIVEKSALDAMFCEGL